MMVPKPPSEGDLGYRLDSGKPAQHTIIAHGGQLAELVVPIIA